MVEATYIPKELASRRRALGMPIDELSSRAGVSINTVNRFLAGKASTRYPHALKISESLGVPGLDLERASDTERMRMRQAIKKAKALVALVQGTSALEGQAVGESHVRHMERKTVSELLSGPRSQLWASM